MVGINEKGRTATVMEECKKLGHIGNYLKNGVERLHADGGGEYQTIEVMYIPRKPPSRPKTAPLTNLYTGHWSNQSE